MNMKENWEAIRTLRDGEPCNHRGCLSHISHPCEGCGRIAGGQIKGYVKEGPKSRQCGKTNYMNEILRKYGRNR